MWVMAASRGVMAWRELGCLGDQCAAPQIAQSPEHCQSLPQRQGCDQRCKGHVKFCVCHVSVAQSPLARRQLAGLCTATVDAVPS